jgi:hypothetical protein
MSLVVARFSKLGVRLYSDSQVTDPSQPRNNLIPGRLKLIVLKPNVCIGFAGQLNGAIDAIREVAKLGSSSAIIEKLVERHRASKEAVDFIVATLQPRSLHKISAGQHFTGGEQYWIGDYDGIKEFEKRFFELPTPAIDDEVAAVAGQMYQAFNSVVSDRAVSTVGGILFSVVTHKGAFLYAPAANVFFPTQEIPSGVPTALRFGGPAEGGYAYSIYYPLEPGVPAAGVYFLQGRCGVLYLPLDVDEPIWFSGISQQGFREAVKEKFGIMIQGVTFD